MMIMPSQANGENADIFSAHYLHYIDKAIKALKYDNISKVFRNYSNRMR